MTGILWHLDNALHALGIHWRRLCDANERRIAR